MQSKIKTEEYIIFCDESEKEGPKFSNFYGGAIINFKKFEFVNENLKSLIKELNLNEVKRQNVSLNYVEKYKIVLNRFFDFVKSGDIKVRVIFSNTEKLEQTKENKRYRYSKFYYKFIKHAFGLSYLPETSNILRLYFDQLPTNKADTLEFKQHIKNLQYTKHLRKKIKITSDNIVDVNSKEHPIIQCVDLITGIIEYYANYVDNSIKLSNRGKAKIELYNLIHKRVEEINPHYFEHIETFDYLIPKNAWKKEYLQCEFKLRNKK